MRTILDCWNDSIVVLPSSVWHVFWCGPPASDRRREGTSDRLALVAKMDSGTIKGSRHRGSGKDRFDGKPLYEAVVDRCRALKIASATVFRGAEGLGEAAEVHRAHSSRTICRS
jgi:hypothetical protein